jgi:hypothetical protein
VARQYGSLLFSGLNCTRTVKGKCGEEAAMNGPSDKAVVWQRSRRCDSATCVEVATTDDRVGVRDGKQPAGPALWFSHEEWAAFVAGVRAGDFD